MYEYFFPNAAERPNKLFNIISMLLHIAVFHGEVYASSANLEGISVWLPSDKVVISPRQIIRSEGIPVMLKMSRGEIARSFGYTVYATAIHERCIQSHHWYLQFIGIAPEFQGKGYASELLNPILARMDKEFTSRFLETQNPENVPIYQHYGFRMIEQGMVPGAEIDHWAMLR